jgi:hypothetical protein
MQAIKLIRLVASSSWRLLAVLAVIVAASAVTMLAVAFGAGSGSGGAGRPGLGFALFSHPSSIAKPAAVGGITPPRGATLAAVAGENTVYAWRPSGAEVCVIDLETSGVGGGACDRTPQAEAHGVVLTLRPGAKEMAAGATLSMAVLVPNGVSSVNFTDRDGSVRTAAVDNNVAVLADADLASVRYTLPDGSEYAQAAPNASAAG